MSKPNPVIKSDLVDKMVFKDLLDESTKVKTLCETEASEVLGQDIFSSLYRYSPKVEEEAPEPQKNLIEQMMALPEYRNLHADTRMDDIASSFGFLKLAPSVIEQFKEVEAKIKEKQKENPDADFEDLSDEEKAQVRAGLRAALREAQDASEEAKGIMKAWGAEPGELQKMPLGRKLQLVEKLKTAKKFTRIAELIGRFSNVQNAVEATTFKHGTDEIVDIEVGSDISRILPSELLKLHQSPVLFYKDMLEGSLMQYQLKGTEHLGRGPIIECMDISASMYGAEEEWCKAATLTLMDVCKKQKRGFGLIAFESIVRSSQYWAAGQSPTLEEKIEIAEIQTRGGTEFLAPLMEAFRLRQQEPDLKPADIVFITDGMCGLSEEQIKNIQKLKENTQTRIFGIGVGSATVGTLEQFCDEISILDLRGDVYSLKDAEKLLQTVGGR